MHRLALWLVLLVPGACDRAGGQAAEPLVVVSDSGGVSVVRVHERAFARLTTCRIDTAAVIGGWSADPDHALFGVRAATLQPDGSIAIANGGTADIRFYDAAGGYTHRLGRSGTGPGEFTWLAWIGTDAAGELVAYDDANRRLTWFDAAGVVARTATLHAVGAGGFPRISGMAGGRVIGLTGFDRVFGVGERRDAAVLYFFGADGAVVDSAGPYAGTERYFHQSAAAAFTFEPILGRTTLAAARGAWTVVGSTDDFQLDVYHGTTLVRRITADRPPVTAAAGVIEAERERLLERPAPAQFRDEMRRAVAGVPVRRTLPAFAQLAVDAAGTIWVGDAAPGAALRWWTLLDPSGSPARRVQLPAGMQLLAVAGASVLALVRDEWDAELLVRLTLASC